MRYFLLITFALLCNFLQGMQARTTELIDQLDQLTQNLTKLNQVLTQEDGDKEPAITPEKIYKKKFPFVWQQPKITSEPKYTQSQAHDSIPEIKKVIQTFLGSTPLTKEQKKEFPELTKSYKRLHGSLKKYSSLITDVRKKEDQFKNTHYVFYHSTPRVMRMAQDLDTAFYNIYNPTTPITNDFIFLRPYNEEALQLPPLTTWVDEKLKKHGTFSNYAPDIQPFLLSVNLAFFGEITRPRSFTFKYFIDSFSAEPPPFGRILNSVLTPFNLEVSRKAFFIGILSDLYDTTIGTKPNSDLLQIFIPKELVNQHVYLSKPGGIPWDTLIAEITDGYDDARKRYTKMSPVMSVYENQPEKIDKEIDSLEGRILLNGNFVRNPRGGLKVFRYAPLDKEAEEKYLKRLNILAQYIYKESQETDLPNRE